MSRNQYARVAGLFVLLLLASGQAFAQSESCETPVACYEQSLEILQEARAQIASLQAELQSAIEALNEKAREVQVQTGRVLITSYTGGVDTFAKPYTAHGGDVFGQAYVLPEIRNRERRNRGIMSGRVDFPEPFAFAPKVLIALSTIDIIKIANARIRTTVDQIDNKGFNYRLHVWGDTDLYRAEVSWIAVAQ